MFFVSKFQACKGCIMILISKYGYILKAFLLDRHIIFNNEARGKKRLVHYSRLLKYLSRSNFIYIYISFYISIQNSLAGTIGTVQSSTHNHKQTSPPLRTPQPCFGFCECIWRGWREGKEVKFKRLSPPTPPFQDEL